jgi:putative cell wall-binding protein
MKKFLLLISPLVVLLLLSGTANAEEIDSVILASEAHYPDALVAGVAANRIGAPLLLTEPGRMSQETLDEIEGLNVSRIYIIGGPYAVNEGVEDELSGKYTVIRIWGMTRFGTSAAIAEYFWQESSKAVLVWDVLGLPAAGNSEIIAKARDLALGQDEYPS